MSVGAYGTNIPIHIEGDVSNYVEIFYCYHENLTYDAVNASSFEKLDSSVLVPAQRESDGIEDEVVEGMYNLQLPLDKFNRKGFYTVYIKPREFRATLADVGSLTAFPNVRGIILDSEEESIRDIKDIVKTNNGLVGYRVVLLDSMGKRQPYYRIVTSSNKCEPVVQAPNSSSDKAYTYRYEDSSSLVFLTLTPSSAPSFKSSALPYIGKAKQRVLLINTLFEPITLDIEMVSNDADTLANLIAGSQLRDLDHGLITTFNESNEVVSQSEVYTLKSTNGTPLYEVKKNKGDNVDFSQTISDK